MPTIRAKPTGSATRRGRKARRTRLSAPFFSSTGQAGNQASKPADKEALGEPERKAPRGGNGKTNSKTSKTERQNDEHLEKRIEEQKVDIV